MLGKPDPRISLTARFTMGSTQSIMFDGAYYYGASDPRRPAAAAIAPEQRE